MLTYLHIPIPNMMKGMLLCIGLKNSPMAEQRPKQTTMVSPMEVQPARARKAWEINSEIMFSLSSYDRCILLTLVSTQLNLPSMIMT